MGRAPCCDKANVKRGTWSPEEDAKLKSYIDRHGTGGNWITLPQKIGLNRCGKSCRLRWLNYLRPNIKHGRFSEEEDNIICSLYISIGSRWSIIAAQLPGRTDNDIKNYWNTRLKKKLLGKEKQARRGRERGARVKQNSGLQTQTQIPVQNEEPRFDDHASTRKLLIRFCDRNRIDGENLKLQYPVMDEPLIPPPVYNNSMDLVSVSAQLILSFNPSSSLPDGADLSSMFPGASHGFSDETTERLMYENPHKLQGLGFFDNDFVNGSSDGKAVTCGENMDWEQMVFAASGLNYNEGFLQGSQMCVPGGLSCRL